MLLQEVANHADVQQEPSQDDDADGEQASRRGHAQQSQAAAAQTRARKLVPAKGSKRSKQTSPAGIDPPIIVEDKLIHKQLPRYAWTLMTRLKLEGAPQRLLPDESRVPLHANFSAAACLVLLLVSRCCEASTAPDCC